MDFSTFLPKLDCVILLSVLCFFFLLEIEEERSWEKDLNSELVQGETEEDMGVEVTEYITLQKTLERVLFFHRAYN